MQKPKIAIICGSKSDLPTLEVIGPLLDRFGISHTTTVASAHRTPKKVVEFCEQTLADGTGLIIAAAGHAAHLAGVVAAHTTLPVVAVPIPSSDLQGLDSLLAMVQMPGGVPVAVMALGRAGAKNSAVFGAQCLAAQFPEVAEQVKRYKQDLAEGRS